MFHIKLAEIYNFIMLSGLPKGAMLTHRGTLATVVAAATVLVRSL